MSEICPHCGMGFKRLASHEWRCKEKKTFSISSSSIKSGSSSVVGSSGTGRHKTPSAGNSSGAGRPTTPSVTVVKTSAWRSSVSDRARRRGDQSPAEIVVQICPDCGANYKYKHEVCHARGSGKREDKAAYDVKEVCPDCGRSYKYSHKVCRGRQKSDPVSHHRLMIPNRPNHPTNQQSTRHNYTPKREHQGREAYGYKDDFDESEGLAAAFEESVNVKETHGRRSTHRHGRNKFVYNGGLSEEFALAAALEASLNLKEERP